VAEPPLTLALPKGRLLDEAVALFARAGIDLGGPSASRKLLQEAGGMRLLIVRDADVPVYVEHGAAELGVAGRDVIEEQARDLYQPLDLRIGGCRLAVAEPIDRPVDERAELHLRVATKYPRLTRRHLEARGVVAEVIALHGSIELAPLAGLADRIVDLVSTGETLKQNRLREVETVLAVTGRLVVNRAALKLRRQAIDALIGKLRRALAGGSRR
jgi:ATP phosphoribosyltransferase